MSALKLRDLKYLELATLKIRPWPKSISVPMCQEARDKFKESLRSVVSLKAVIGMSHRAGYDWKTAEHHAGRGIKKMPQTEAKAEILAKKAHEAFFSSAPTPEHWDDSDRKMVILIQGINHVHVTVERLMQGMCVLAWTAVEVLLHDLITGSIDIHGQKPDPQRPKAKPSVKQREG